MPRRLRRLPLIALALICLAARPGSVDALADGLATRARPVLGAGDVAVAVSGPWPRLADEVGALLVTRLRAAGLRASQADGDAARARAAGFAQLLRVELTTDGNVVRASGGAWALPGALWSDQPVELAHLHAEAPLDAELKAYQPARPSREGTPDRPWQVRSMALGDVGLRAIAVGDSDGDGRPELVGATAGELYAWTVGPGGAVERWRVRLPGRPAPQRARLEVAAVTVENGATLARSSELAEAVRRDARGTLSPARGFPLAGVGACELEPGLDVFSGACAQGLVPERFWTAAALKRPSSDRAAAVAAILPAAASESSGTLWLRLADAPPVSVRGVGAQLALGSLDRGDVVVTSQPTEGEPDGIVIRALDGMATPLHRLDRLPGAVRALALGDVDGDGRAEIVAAVRDDAAQRTELWLVN